MIHSISTWFKYLCSDESGKGGVVNAMLLHRCIILKSSI